uniref:Protein kinase domain-containing protein n=1 Tax=Leptobrachium leishanense TaxID=445787 RepID=A0A8C5QLV0_9ANUR
MFWAVRGLPHRCFSCSGMSGSSHAGAAHFPGCQGASTQVLLIFQAVRGLPHRCCSCSGLSGGFHTGAAHVPGCLGAPTQVLLMFRAVRGLPHRCCSCSGLSGLPRRCCSCSGCQGVSTQLLLLFRTVRGLPNRCCSCSGLSGAHRCFSCPGLSGGSHTGVAHVPGLSGGSHTGAAHVLGCQGAPTQVLLMFRAVRGLPHRCCSCSGLSGGSHTGAAHVPGCQGAPTQVLLMFWAVRGLPHRCCSCSGLSGGSHTGAAHVLGCQGASTQALHVFQAVRAPTQVLLMFRAVRAPTQVLLMFWGVMGLPHRCCSCSGAVRGLPHRCCSCSGLSGCSHTVVARVPGCQGFHTFFASSAGRGEFGEVFLAKAQGLGSGANEAIVLVKSLQTRDEQLQLDFRRELDMFSKLNHNNVVRLLGQCREAEPHYIILEYVDLGDLKQFLRISKSKDEKLKTHPLSSKQKVALCSQVALGMEHLSNARFVLKDLAARNCLVSAQRLVKVSALGLSKDVYNSEYYHLRQAWVPLRWMPPEAVQDDDFSTKSDIWSFGVLMWEVFTHGELPYTTMPDDEVLAGLQAGSLKLSAPDGCSSRVYKLMQRCWAPSPKDRPSFSDIVNTLGDVPADSKI